jgi:hypothetical protein
VSAPRALGIDRSDQCPRLSTGRAIADMRSGAENPRKALVSSAPWRPPGSGLFVVTSVGLAIATLPFLPIQLTLQCNQIIGGLERR